MKKQIEEIKDWIDSMYGCDCAYFGVDGLMIAEGLYNAGYRKQIVAEWKAGNENGQYSTKPAAFQRDSYRKVG